MAGRPSSYKPEYCEQALSFLSQGYSKEALAGELGVCRDTVYKWIERYPEFADTIKKGDDLCLKWWEELGHEMVMNGGGNAAVWIFNMKNRFGWRDRTETELSGADGEPIKINLVTGAGFVPASAGSTA